jgi:hypothetical protein
VRTKSVIARSVVTAGLALAVMCGRAGARRTSPLPRKNPIAAMYSLPCLNNTYFGVGRSHDDTANVLSIQAHGV